MAQSLSGFILDARAPVTLMGSISGFAWHVSHCSCVGRHLNDFSELSIGQTFFGWKPLVMVHVFIFIQFHSFPAAFMLIPET